MICKVCQIEKPETDFSPNRAKCKACLAIWAQDYQAKNKVKIQDYNKQYQLKNKKKLSDKTKQLVDEGYFKRHYKNGYKNKRKEYYSTNREKILTYRQKYTHTPEYLEARRKYMKQKRASDPAYKIRANVSRRIRDVLKGVSKSEGTLKLLGCDVSFLRRHLESLFQAGMSWENYGINGWHIDHIIPCSNFDLSKPEGQSKCFHYSNLQPLWAKDNLSKGSKVF